MPAAADPPDDIKPLALESLLRWYLAMGVDASILDTPSDRFRELSAVQTGEKSPVSRQADIASNPALAVPPTAATADEIAARCRSLDELQAAWAEAPGCGLAASATHMIFSGGHAGSRVMIFGGAPDSDDERDGNAFAGSKGRLLDAMLRAVELTRDDVYLANVVPWRPPGNRAPTPLELDACLPFVRRHIELASPSILVCLGERAAQPLLGTTDPIGRLRGRWFSYEGPTSTTRALVTFSLESLLNQPLQKRRAWQDLMTLAAALVP